jgi:hypothetical protein
LGSSGGFPSGPTSITNPTALCGTKTINAIPELAVTACRYKKK